MSELKQSHQQQQRGCLALQFSVFADFFFGHVRFQVHTQTASKEERRSSRTEKRKDKENNVAVINSRSNQKHGRQTQVNSR